MSTTVYCAPAHEEDDVCRRCGAVILAPNQVCYGTVAERRRAREALAQDADEYASLDEPMTRRDWRALLRAAERECHHLVRRCRRPTSEPDGVDARALERLRRIVPALARAAGDEPRFV